MAKIKTDELKAILKEDLGLKSKVEAGEIIEDIDAVIETAIKQLAEGDSVKVGKYIKIEKKLQAGKTGEITRKTPEGEIVKTQYTTEDKVVVKISVTPAGKELA